MGLEKVFVMSTVNGLIRLQKKTKNVYYADVSHNQTVAVVLVLFFSPPTYLLQAAALRTTTVKVVCDLP